MDLIPKQPGKVGRKQNVSARAWIGRAASGDVFISMVSLGKGRTYKLSTETRNREKALEFNRSHLLKLLMSRPSTGETKVHEEQLLLLNDSAA